MALKTKDFTITQGSTFQHDVRWSAPFYVYKPITAITQAGPAVITSTAHGILDGWQVAIVSVKGMTQINASNPPKLTEFVRATVTDADTIKLNTVNSATYKPYTSGGYVQYLSPVDLTGFTARMEIKDKIGGVILANSASVAPAGSLVFDSTAVGTRTVTGTGTAFSAEHVGRTITLDTGKVATITAVASATSLTAVTTAILSTTSFATSTWVLTANITISIDTSAHVISLLLSAITTAAITWKKAVYDLEAVSSTGVVTALLSGKFTVVSEVTT